MKHFHHWKHIQAILDSYQGAEPLSRFLAQYFRNHKQMGSQDRKFASRYIYAFFRLGNALSQEDITFRVSVADFLCNRSPSPVAQFYLPQLQSNNWQLTLAEKLDWVKTEFPTFDVAKIFLHSLSLSEGITNQNWSLRMLQQPNLFIRVAKDFLSNARSILNQHEISFEILSETCISLPNTTKLSDILLEKKFEVQDFSSQQTGDFFKPKTDEYWWDCCAASGGKSLLLHSLCPSVKILASDIREQSLENLKQRFLNAGITKFHIKTLDLLQNNKAQLIDYQFDGILVDAPCSGSGTWARTPENNYFFESQSIKKFTSLQENIVQNVIPYLKSGKPLIYMTCSIFAEENEQMVEKILVKNSDLNLESFLLIDGTAYGADSMFVARMLKK